MAAHPEARFAYETLTGGFIDREFVAHRPREARIIDDVSQLHGQEVVKVLVRLDTSDSQAMHDLVDPLVEGTCHASFSEPDNGLVELAPAGITKAKTLSDLCDHLGVARSQVMAFGDMPNDIEMLSWAGRGSPWARPGVRSRRSPPPSPRRSTRTGSPATSTRSSTPAADSGASVQGPPQRRPSRRPSRELPLRGGCRWCPRPRGGRGRGRSDRPAPWPGRRPRSDRGPRRPSPAPTGCSRSPPSSAATSSRPLAFEVPSGAMSSQLLHPTE